MTTSCGRLAAGRVFAGVVADVVVPGVVVVERGLLQFGEHLRMVVIVRVGRFVGIERQQAMPEWVYEKIEAAGVRLAV